MKRPNTKFKKVYKEGGFLDKLSGAAGAVPGYGTLISGAIQASSAMGKAVQGDGTSVGRNIAAGTLNPLGRLESLFSSNAKEAIPIFGDIAKAKRLQGEQEDNANMQMSSDLLQADQVGASIRSGVPRYQAPLYGKRGMKLQTKFKKSC